MYYRALVLTEAEATLIGIGLMVDYQEDPFYQDIPLDVYVRTSLEFMLESYNVDGFIVVLEGYNYNDWSSKEFANWIIERFSKYIQ